MAPPPDFVPPSEHWRSEWTLGHSTPAEEHVGAFWFFACLWLLVIQFFNPSGFWETILEFRTNWWVPLIGISGIFHAVGVYLVGLAIWNQVSRRRFGRTRLTLETLPGYLGESFRAVLHIPRIPAEFPGEPHVVGTCVETIKREKRTSTETRLWSGPARAVLSQDSSGWTLAISLDLPSTKPETRHGGDSATSIRWELQVHLPLAGMDFKRTYAFPVFKRP